MSLPAQPTDDSGEPIATQVKALAEQIRESAQAASLQHVESPILGPPPTLEANAPGGTDDISPSAAQVTLEEPAQQAPDGSTQAGNEPAPSSPPVMQPAERTLPNPTAQAAAPSPSLRQRAEQRLASRSDSAANVLDLELLRLLADEAGTAQLAGGESGGLVRKPAPVIAGDLSEEDRQLLGIVCDGLASFRDLLHRAEAAAGPAPLMAEKAQPLADMVEALRWQVGLTLPAVVLCSEVRLFGDYTPMGTSFVAGKAHPTILYVEVDHFASQQASDGAWETKLTLAATLYDAGGKPVWELPAAPALDRCRQKRRDFFMRSRLTLPASLRAGQHVLKVTVCDRQTGRMAERSLAIQITPATTVGLMMK